MQWTTIVMAALSDAKKHPHKRVVIDVATDFAYTLIDDALFTLIAQGDDAAWRIELKQHTLH